MSKLLRREMLSGLAAAGTGLAVAGKAAAEISTFFAGGDGSDADPYQIETPEQLQAVQEDLSAAYVLVDDLDMDGVDFEPIGPSDPRNGTFNGQFEGDGHAIAGLTIDRPSEDAVGLFRFTNAAGIAVQNLELRDVDVVGNSGVGALAAANNSRIEAVGVTGSVSGGGGVGGVVGGNSGEVVTSRADVTVAANSTVGGVAGGNGIEQLGAGGTIVDCAAHGSVIGETASAELIGGLVGENTLESSIDRAYSRAGVEGGTDVGGLVGRNNDESTITTAYAAGAVSGEAATGGLVGTNNDATVSDSYWDRETTGQSASAGLPDDRGLETDAMTGYTAEETLSSFDFDAEWQITGSYPILGWEPTDGEAIAAIVSIPDQTSNGEEVLISRLRTTADGSFSIVAGDGGGTFLEPVEVLAGEDRSEAVFSLDRPIEASQEIIARLSFDGATMDLSL